MLQLFNMFTERAENNMSWVQTTDWVAMARRWEGGEAKGRDRRERAGYALTGRIRV